MNILSNELIWNCSINNLVLFVIKVSDILIRLTNHLIFTIYVKMQESIIEHFFVYTQIN